ETILNEAEAKANQILKQAEDEYKRKRQQLESEEVALEQKVQEAIQTAKEEGYQAGYNQGIEEGAQQYSQALEEIYHLIDSAKQNYIGEIEQAEPMIIELA